MASYWEKKADAYEEKEAKEAFEKIWEAEMGDQHLDPEARYCKEVVDRSSRGITIGFNGEDVIDGMLKQLFHHRHKMMFADDDKRSAMIDPVLPKITDDEIMEHMGVSLQKKELKNFMRMLRFTKKFVDTRDNLCKGMMAKHDYHSFEYDGEFGDFRSWGLI